MVFKSLEMRNDHSSFLPCLNNNTFCPIYFQCEWNNYISIQCWLVVEKSKQIKIQPSYNVHTIRTVQSSFENKNEIFGTENTACCDIFPLFLLRPNVPIPVFFLHIFVLPISRPLACVYTLFHNGSLFTFWTILTQYFVKFPAH